MQFTPKNPKTKEHIVLQIETNKPSLYVSSKTSTVIPYEKLSEYIEGELDIVNLGLMTPEMSFEDDHFICSGSVNWKDAKSFCEQNGRQIMTYPTEELACILAGVATSCTGERSFGFGTLRDQIVELSYINHEGVEQTLKASNNLSDHKLFKNKEAKKILKKYQESYTPYHGFKNAPFPRLERETDLLVGTEGQLGVVTQIKLKTVPNDNLRYLFFALEPWEKNINSHLEVFEKVQAFRDQINSCELVDSNSLRFLKPDQRPVENKDLIFFEIKDNNFEDIYEKLLSQLDSINDEDVFEMSRQKFFDLRMGVPRAVFEANTAAGVVKKGTDVQVAGFNFQDLLNLYREFAKSDIGYNLFGHFGDAHLHFNFMPTPDQEQKCQQLLESFYKDVKNLGGSPFAEHGIGLLKQRFIKEFWDFEQKDMFKFLKSQMDPHGHFFPQGYMSL